MKLTDLFTNGETVANPDHHVTSCAAFDADGIQPTTLRWWNGRTAFSNIRAAFSNIRAGGVVVVPMGASPELPDTLYVQSADPKASFMAALRTLYPEGSKCNIRAGIGVFAHPSAVIGQSGFGFVGNERVPHIGGVDLHSRVEIGAHTCIDRGTLGNTTIGEDTKVDNLVHIAHNVVIGKRCKITAGAIIGGSAVIGDDVFVGIGARIRNGVRIGQGAIVGMGAVVVRDVPKGATVAGNPARELPAHAPPAV